MWRHVIFQRLCYEEEIRFEVRSVLLKRIISLALAASLGCGAPALAGEARGAIITVDADAMQMTLDNGVTYTLPPEFDVTLITPGMIVALAHEDDAAKTVTDMEQID